MSKNTTSSYHEQPPEAFFLQPEISPADIEIVTSQPAATDFDGNPIVETPRYRGRFQKGYDPRRHQFTDEERSAGFWTAIAVMGVSIGAKLHRAGRFPNYRKGGCR